MATAKLNRPWGWGAVEGPTPQTAWASVTIEGNAVPLFVVGVPGVNSGFARPDYGAFETGKALKEFYEKADISKVGGVL